MLGNRHVVPQAMSESCSSDSVWVWVCVNEGLGDKVVVSLHTKPGALKEGGAEKRNRTYRCIETLPGSNGKGSVGCCYCLRYRNHVSGVLCRFQAPKKKKRW